MSGADEFEVIRRWFAPLAAAPGARELLDDVAVFEPDGPLALTTDAIVEGVHFLPSDPMQTVAQKALRVNLSDLAAKAARPVGYLLTLFWPNERPAAEIARFAEGLAADQARFGLGLLGGDTVATPGPLSVAITAFGSLEGARAPDRRFGTAGQDLWVSGEIGDGWLGLQAALGRLDWPDAALAQPLARYRTPEPRLQLAELLRAEASAAMDLSDGLIADASKLAQASGVGAELWLDQLPLSAAGARYLAAAPDGRAQLACGGDDYEILFSADPAARPRLERWSGQAGLRLTRIGRLDAAPGVRVLEDGRAIATPCAGFAHRLGR